MNPDVKQAWLTALRSGEYKQGVGGLHSGNTWCCLGVICDLAAKAGIGHWEDGQGYLYFMAAGESTYDYPPSPVVNWAGLDISNPRIQRTPITDYNDGAGGVPGHTFAEIADLIEQYL